MKRHRAVRFLGTLLTLALLGAGEAEGKIVGQVQRLVGDFMPHRDESETRGKVFPLPARVFVYRGRLSSERVPAKGDARLVKVVRADEHGGFEIDLPAGTYTLFAEIDGELYLNGLDGWGHWAHVSLSPGKVVRSSLVDNRAATF
jgi:hypothetical protein